MDRELLRNGSGYVDITAYKALNNIEREENIVEYKRGDIVEYTRANGELVKALIVSANHRSGGKYQNYIMLSDTDWGTGAEVKIMCTDGAYYANCNMVSSARNDSFGAFLEIATAQEMEEIDLGISYALDIKQEIIENNSAVSVVELSDLEELASARAEAKVYKDLYDKLLQQVISGR